METAPHITFHQLPHSAALEDEIRREIAELDTLYDRLISCRVVVATPHHHPQQRPLFDVRIDLRLPGDRIVVGGAEDQQPGHEDAHLAVRDAFRVARHQLQRHVQRRTTLATEPGEGLRSDKLSEP